MTSITREASTLKSVSGLFCVELCAYSSLAVFAFLRTGGPSTDSLTQDTKLILEELSRFLNMEKLIPSYRLVVTVACLKAIRLMQKFGHLPPDCTLFKSYAVHGNFLDVRLAALEALVDFMQGNLQHTHMWPLERHAKCQLNTGSFRNRNTVQA